MEARADAQPRPEIQLDPRFFSRIIHSLADGVIVANREGRLTLFNPAAERILGLGLADVPLPEWSSTYGCYLPDTTTSYPSDQLPLARSLRGEEVHNCEIYIRRDGNEGRWISANSAPLRGSSGEVLGGVVVFRDVSAQKSGVDRMQLLSTVVEQTADSVLVTGRTGRIEYVNPAFERMTGFTAAEVLGQNPRLLKSGLHAPGFYEELWTTLLGGQPYRGTLTDRRKDGGLFLSEQTITPIFDAHGTLTHLVSVARDVTERIRAAAREASLQLARRVQQRLYPLAPPTVPGFDISGTTLAADIIGGDYFDFVTFPGGGLGLVIGDVSGHGFDAAILMAETRAVLRSMSQVEADPGCLLCNVNRVLASDVDENRFVGMVVLNVDPATRECRYANAGHTPGYVLDARGTVRAELASTGVPLGPFPDARIETLAVPQLEPGDVVVLVTDGMTELWSPNGDMCGADFVLEVVRGHGHESAAAIVDGLCEAARAFADGALQGDDATAVVCKAIEVA
jgi:sigma-B regulation protein RsbU (phosphoserine phosphatase)